MDDRTYEVRSYVWQEKQNVIGMCDLDISAQVPQQQCGFSVSTGEPSCRL